MPVPDSYGWETGNTFEPVVTYLKPAPDAVTELISCGCGTGKCKSYYCSSRKAALLVCTEMCVWEGVQESCLITELKIFK